MLMSGTSGYFFGPGDTTTNCRIGYKRTPKSVAFFLLLGCKSATIFGAHLQPIQKCVLGYFHVLPGYFQGTSWVHLGYIRVTSGSFLFRLAV